MAGVSAGGRRGSCQRRCWCQRRLQCVAAIRAGGRYQRKWQGMAAVRAGVARTWQVSANVARRGSCQSRCWCERRWQGVAAVRAGGGKAWPLSARVAGVAAVRAGAGVSAGGKAWPLSAQVSGATGHTAGALETAGARVCDATGVAGVADRVLHAPGQSSGFIGAILANVRSSRDGCPVAFPAFRV